MGHMTISQIAAKAGLQASAIRYYEQIGLMPPAHRIGGQRRYDSTVLYRLAVVQRARRLGFTLEEIRELFFGFRSAMPASKRWRTLSEKKLAELSELAKAIRTMQRLLRRVMTRCHCETLDQCGKAIFLRDSKSRTTTTRREF